MASDCLNRSESSSPLDTDLVSICVVATESNVCAELKNIFPRSDGFHYVGSFANASEAITELALNNPHIVLVQAESPGVDGLECLKQLVSGLHGSNVVILTAITQIGWLNESLAAGAHGLLAKSCDRQQLITALHCAAAGAIPFSKSLLDLVLSPPVMKRKILGTLPELNQKQREILDLLSRGFLYKEIASKLGFKIGNLKRRLHDIFEKLKVDNRTEAISIWRGH